MAFSIKLFTTTLFVSIFISCHFSCSSDSDDSVQEITINGEEITETDNSLEGEIGVETSSVLGRYFGEAIDLEKLDNYANQNIPIYIRKDNTGNNEINNMQATLGRVLFYDKQLSVDNSISCSSCHMQEFAFGDTKLVSDGVNGKTARHSMRLVNTRFADEVRFFWDERANTLEEQTTQPIQDHIEMGFSGQNGDPSISDLTIKLEGLDYYKELFHFAFGDSDVNESRIQQALAQFIRSIQSFDSKYDAGRRSAVNDAQNFANYTSQENLGKSLFLSPPDRGGVGCAGCHRAPEFDIDPNSRNNGIIGVFGSNEIDVMVTRSPSLRDIFNTNGILNGALMHDASKITFREVLEHYNSISVRGNTNLDRRLDGGAGANGQQLNMSIADMEAIEAFIKTLSGSDIYENPKWSNPFL